MSRPGLRRRKLPYSGMGAPDEPSTVGQRNYCGGEGGSDARALRQRQQLTPRCAVLVALEGDRGASRCSIALCVELQAVDQILQYDARDGGQVQRAHFLEREPVEAR